MVPLRRPRSYRRGGIYLTPLLVVRDLAAKALGSLNACPVCGVAVSAAPVCAECDALLARALAAARPFGDNLWLGPYAGALLRMVHALKFSGQRALGSYLGRLLAVQASRASWKFDSVTNVPASAGKLRTRGFDQAELMARAAAEHSGRDYRRLLTRTITMTARSSQLALGRDARSVNASGAFVADAGAAGRTVLLVDDVSTSGATLAACRQALLAAGATRVFTAVVALTVRSEADLLEDDDEGGHDPEECPHQHLRVGVA